MTCNPARLALLLAVSTATPSPLLAQTPPPAAKAAQADARVFTPADFARYQPKTAYDMLLQLPGFTLQVATNDRGLGQASENVLINGERVTDKTAGAVARLQNTPASRVARIEIVSAATLGIAGLTGQVANVVLTGEAKGIGNFEWKPTVRPYYALPSLLRGTVTYSGSRGDLGYTLSLQNRGGRGAIGGPNYVVTDAAGVVTERRDQVVHNEFNDARLSGVFNYGAKGPVRANLSLVYDPYWNSFNNFQRRFDNGDANDWRTIQKINGYVFSASGDVAFNVGPGELKLIGLRTFEHAPSTVVQRADYDSAAPSTGSRFGNDSRISETIGRGEYHWKSGLSDWRLSLERAYNKLDQRGSLADLTPAGVFADTPFPEGIGVVAEERYEAIATLSRPIGSKLDLQMAGGSEYSLLQHLDISDPARRFLRPKGSISLAWRPAAGWDLNLKLARRVGQIKFYDFLAQRDLVLGRQSGANPELVPPQSWELTGEVGRDFGRWGKTRVKVYDYEIADIVDVIPVGPTDDAVGNLPRATRLGVESKSTIQFDPVGWAGAKLDMTFGAESSRVRDPLTAELRPIGATHDAWSTVELRDDVPGTQWAWGGGFYLDHYGWAYYLSEVNRNWEGPYASLFVENKNVAGLKVRLEAFNINDGRSHFDRLVYAGRRNITAVSVQEHTLQRVGPIFTLSLRGTFD